MPKINNNTFYLNATKKHGHTPKGLNWKDKSSQIKRFEIILEFIKDELTPKTKIVDAGCGFGDFYLFLKSRGFEVQYVGYDVVEKFVNIAKTRTSCKIVKRDILSDDLEEADFYIASGSLNILTPFETILFIKRCFTHSTKGFVFNFLEGDGFDKNFNTLRREEIEKYAKDLGAEAWFRDGYIKGDVTCYYS